MLIYNSIKYMLTLAIVENVVIPQEKEWKWSGGQQNQANVTVHGWVRVKKGVSLSF